MNRDVYRSSILKGNRYVRENLLRTMEVFSKSWYMLSDIRSSLLSNSAENMLLHAACEIEDC